MIRRGDHWLGLYSVTRSALAEHKFVLREIASRMIAAPVFGQRVVPDHKLHVIKCDSTSEAEWLTHVLNGDLITKLATRFTMRHVNHGIDIPLSRHSRLLTPPES